jgi:hypothetical protein
MTANIEIDKYSGGWMSPLRLERLFADSLIADPKIAQFKPSEIELKKKSNLTASNVAGAVSKVVLGIGWKNVALPTAVVGFESCPVQLAVFSLHNDFLRGRFFFQLKYRNGSKYSGVTFIRRKGAGVFSSGDPNELEIAPGNPSCPGTTEMRADKAMNASLLSLANLRLNQKPWICTVTYELIGGVPAGKIEFDIHHSKKKWENALKESNTKADDYIFNVFNNACAMASHIS